MRRSRDIGAASDRDRPFTHNGQQTTIRELARATGLSVWTLYQRYNRGDRGPALVRPRGTMAANWSKK